MSSALNVIKAHFGAQREVTTAPLWQYDYGQILEITGLDLPQAFEVHFSNSRKSGETVAQIGTDSQVVIPDMYLTSGADIYAFIFLHDGLTDGETEYVIKIPVRERPEPSDIEPTPEQQDAITEAIAALNVAVEQTGEDKAATAALAEAAAESARQAASSASDIEDLSVSAETLESGSQATVSKTKPDKYHLTFGIPKGNKGDTGDSGVYIGDTEPTDPDVKVWIDVDDTDVFNAGDVTYSSADTYSDGTVGKAINNTNDALRDIMPTELTWTIGKTISSTGAESIVTTGAMSDPIAVEGGNYVTRRYPVADTNGNNIIIHVCQYINGVFQSRTSLTTSGMTLDASTTSVRFNCSRASATGIPMTQGDVNTYFLATLYRKYDPIADLTSKIRSITITSAVASATYSGLLANLPANTVCWTLGTWWTDAPITGYFYLINLRSINTSTLTPMSGQGTQIAINPDRAVIYTRRIKSGNWTSWMSADYSFPTYYAFGDSLTWGAVWDSDTTTDLYQADYNDQIPTRIARAIGSKSFTNYGASGARYVKQSGDSASKKTIVDLIKGTSFTGVDIVTIGGGRNDSATALGDGDTATANDGTICGALVDALTYLTTNYPKLQIVVYGVTPQPTSTAHAPSDIYTRVFSGGWSLAAFYTEMAKVCARFGVPFIDWYGCTLILRWGDLSGGYSGGTQNWSHPLSSDIYKQLGNYLAGKVSSYYSG